MFLLDRIETPRLVLRAWKESDRIPFAAMNADPRVMEFFPKVLSSSESDEAFGRVLTHFDRYGFGIWALEARRSGEFLGLLGLQNVRFEAKFTPAVEIGWRLRYEAWGKGFATEGAQAALKAGFGRLGLSEIVAMTVPENQRSRRVMEKLGMTYVVGEDFNHPLIEEGSRYRRHILYRKKKETFRD